MFLYTYNSSINNQVISLPSPFQCSYVPHVKATEFMFKKLYIERKINRRQWNFRYIRQPVHTCKNMDSQTQDPDTANLKENLQAQLSELEMLQSAFCNPGEIQVDDVVAVADINEYVNDKTKIIPSPLDYTVNLNVDGRKVDINVSVSHRYPRTKPDIFVRINDLNRTQRNKFNSDLRDCITDIEGGEVCVFSIITWIQENVLLYAEEITADTVEKAQVKDKCARFWIYSHHIYNKTKRREILSLSSDYSLTGFSLPGKPGIVCIEGHLRDCNAWWSYIRNLTWHKIVCKHVETDEDGDLGAFRKFASFDEIVFQSANVKSTHMDMGEFYTYLEEHRCEYIFKELFGVDSKTV